MQIRYALSSAVENLAVTTSLLPAAGQVWGVAVRYTRFPAQHVQDTRLLHSFASGFSGHFASLVVSKKVPPT